MTGLLVTVDLGNSRAKARLWSLGRERRPELLDAAAFDSGGGLAEGLAAFLRRVPAGSRGAVSAVAAPALAARVGELLRAALGPEGLLAPDPGLDVDCEEPSAVGADRLFAARGTAELLGRSAVVVSAGTALCVDALEVAGGRGRFLGGAIAPGAALWAPALARAARSLAGAAPAVRPSPSSPALGRSTRAAIEGGVSAGFRGAARELVLRVGSESGIGASRLAITGGARHLLLDPPLLEGAQILAEEDLVHLGLAAAVLGGACGAASLGWSGR